MSTSTFTQLLNSGCMRLHTGVKENVHWKLTLGEKSLAAPWTRTRASDVKMLDLAFQWDALPIELFPLQRH